MSEPARVILRIDNGIATVVLNRPDRHNALDLPMFSELQAAAAELATTTDLRAVVLAGAGRSFCSGLDVEAFTAPDDDYLQALLARPDRDDATLVQRAVLDWADLPVPVIAAVHGNCLGGGFQLALGADVRIATPDSRLSILEIAWGLIPDMGITQTLPELVGYDVAVELASTGRVITGDEAHGLGLVTSVAADPRVAALELAATIAGRSPDAVRAVKQLFREAWHNRSLSVLHIEASLQLGLLGTPNQVEAVRAAIAREVPRFDPPLPG